jgi:hypothetical protein
LFYGSPTALDDEPSQQGVVMKYPDKMSVAAARHFHEQLFVDPRIEHDQLRDESKSPSPTMVSRTFTIHIPTASRMLTIAGGQTIGAAGGITWTNGTASRAVFSSAPLTSTGGAPITP